MTVFLVVLIVKPTQKQVYDDGATPIIVAGPQVVLADNDVQASGKAMRFLPEEYKDKVDRVEVAVMPFRRAGA